MGSRLAFADSLALMMRAANADCRLLLALGHGLTGTAWHDRLGIDSASQTGGQSDSEIVPRCGRWTLDAASAQQHSRQTRPAASCDATVSALGAVAKPGLLAQLTSGERSPQLALHWRWRGAPGAAGEDSHGPCTGPRKEDNLVEATAHIGDWAISLAR